MKSRRCGYRPSSSQDPTVAESQTLAPLSQLAKAGYFTGGNLLPLVCMFAMANGMHVALPDWQSHQFDDFAAFFMSGAPAPAFCPFLACSIGSS